MAQILIAGESWVTHSIHQKGVDSFTSSSYHEGVGPLRAALEAGGFEVDYLPNHLAAAQFPTDLDGLRRYRVVMLSDIGANTLLLHPDTAERGLPTANRLALLRDYVEGGGGLVMIGGYLTFQGMDGRARYAGTPVEDVLPVTLDVTDDRVEAPEGQTPRVRLAAHPIVAGLADEWPQLLGYNRVHPKPGADVIVELDSGDPLVVAWNRGQGRAVAFTSDCGPHWCPPPFLEWAGYGRLWPQLAGWVAGS
jgi:uncharacterized membrane protein